MSRRIEPVLIKSPRQDSDATSPKSMISKTPTIATDDTNIGIGSRDPFQALTPQSLTPADLDNIIQRLLTTATSPKITKEFCLKGHEIIALYHGTYRMYGLANNSRPKDIDGSTDLDRVNTSSENRWRHPWPIRRFNPYFRIIWMAAKLKLPLFRKLR